jgi:hypothetical protein
MNETELRNAAIRWLSDQSKIIKLRPHPFTPTEVTREVGGYPGTLGKIADVVVSELRAQGVNVRYVRSARTRFFELLR